MRLNNKGFSVLEAVIVVGIIAIALFGISHVMQTALKGAAKVERMQEFNSIISTVQYIFQAPGGCNLNMTTNIPAPSFNATPGTIQNQVVNMTAISFPTGPNYITVGGTLDVFTITQIRLNLRAVMTPGTSYLANLRIMATVPEGTIIGLNQFFADIPVNLRTTPGAPPNVTINGCVTTGGRSSCPAGFTLVSTPGTEEAFCISTAAEAARNVAQANNFCLTHPTAGQSARLCSPLEWASACSLVGGAIGLPAVEWASGYIWRDNGSGAFPSGTLMNQGPGPACYRFDSWSANMWVSNYPFRCCFY